MWDTRSHDHCQNYAAPAACHSLHPHARSMIALTSLAAAAALLHAPPVPLVRTPPHSVHNARWQATAAQPSTLQVAACTTRPNGAFARRSSPAVCSASGDEQPLVAAAAAGLVANAVVFVSLYFVATTGGGLPAGPFGLLGALEGVSYLVVVGFVGAALRSKLSTGAGLPSGPAGLLGAAEGISFLSVVGGLAVLALLVAQQGCVPNALPLVDYSSMVQVCKGEPGLFGGVL